MTGESIFKITADIEALEKIMARLETTEESETAFSKELDQEARHDLDTFLTHKKKLLAEKVDGYVSFYRHLEARKKARREEAAHLGELARQDDAKMKRLKEAVKFVSEQLGEAKLLGKTRSITVSTSKRPAVDITDQEAVPVEFKEMIPISYRVLKPEIVKHIQATGEIPPGVETRPIVSVRFK